MLTAETAKDYRCPRWDELPALPLYMDQVVMVITSVLEVFSQGDEPVITSTMVNNYVKLKIMTPPEKKRYVRSQITYLIALCFFKRVFSISEISQVITLLKKQLGSKHTYDLFCERLEQMLADAYGGAGVSLRAQTRDNSVEGIMDTALAAVIAKLMVQETIAVTADAAP